MNNSTANIIILKKAKGKTSINQAKVKLFLIFKRLIRLIKDKNIWI